MTGAAPKQSGGGTNSRVVLLRLLPHRHEAFPSQHWPSDSTDRGHATIGGAHGNGIQWQPPAQWQSLGDAQRIASTPAVGHRRLAKSARCDEMAPMQCNATDRIFPSLNVSLTFASFPCEFQRFRCPLLHNWLSRCHSFARIACRSVANNLLAGGCHHSFGLAIHKQNAHREGVSQFGWLCRMALYLARNCLLRRQLSPLCLIPWPVLNNEAVDCGQIGLRFPMDLCIDGFPP